MQISMYITHLNTSVPLNVTYLSPPPKKKQTQNTQKNLMTYFAVILWCVSIVLVSNHLYTKRSKERLELQMGL